MNKAAAKAWLGILLAASFAAWLSCGCAMTPMERARTVVATSAQAVVAVDGILAGPYAALAAEANPDPDKVRRWNATVSSLLLARSSILMAEHALDSIEAGQDGEIHQVLACVAASILRLVEALPEIDVRVPDALVLALNILGTFTGECTYEPDPEAMGIPHARDAFAVTP